VRRLVLIRIDQEARFPDTYAIIPISKGNGLHAMVSFTKIYFLLLSASLTACSFNGACCGYIRDQDSSSYVKAALKSTSLEYLIDYGPDSYDLTANFDVLFLSKESSTNGCTAHIHGKYGELVKSNELNLRGNSEGVRVGEFTQNQKWNWRYYLTGMINRPDTEAIRERNKRALSIHVEENYVVEYEKK
jgi:hypothetical protein